MTDMLVPLLVPLLLALSLANLIAGLMILARIKAAYEKISGWSWSGQRLAREPESAEEL